VKRERRLFARSLAVGMVLVLLAAACGDDDDDDDAGSGGSTASTEGATETTAAGSTDTTTAGEDATTTTAAATGDFDPDGEIVMGYTGSAQQLDPHKQVAGADMTYWGLVYDRLTEVSNADLSIVPMLATSWEFAADGTSMEMTLRDDVVFHDGTPFDADAVVANVDRMKNAEGSTAARQLTSVASVEKIDDFTVRWVLSGPAANLPALLSSPAGAMISPAAFDDPSVDLATDPQLFGSGPYVVAEHTPLERTVFERAPEYWNTEHATLARLTIEYAPASEARLNGLQSGAFDVIAATGTDATTGYELVDSGDFVGAPVAINTIHGLMLNPTRGDLANQQVRQAINYALNREEIAAGLFDGYCQVTFQVFKEATPWYTPAVDEQYTYDPDRARELIAESGIENPTFDLRAPEGPSYQPLAQVMQAQLAEVGITANISPGALVDSNVAFLSGELDSLELVVLGQADPSLVLSQWYLSGPGSGMLPAGTPLRAEVEAAALAALDNTLTIEERAEMYGELFTELGEQSLWVPGCATNQVWLGEPDVVGLADMPFIWAGPVVPYTLGRAAG
jgi:peptide/nickel transport system substrate-binding protein